VLIFYKQNIHTFTYILVDNAKLKTWFNHLQCCLWQERYWAYSTAPRTHTGQFQTDSNINEIPRTIMQPQHQAKTKSTPSVKSSLVDLAVICNT